MINLYTTFYNEKNEPRKQELISCIKKNVENSHFSTIVIFNEGDSLKELCSEKIVEVQVNKRPTYDDFIGYINSHTFKDTIHIIANTDIFFEKEIAVLEHLSLRGICFAMARWDTTESKKPLLFNHNDSQDAWVFKGMINEELKAPYPLGVARCDNRFLYDLELAGYKVLNPAFSIKAFHMHKGQRHVIYTEADNIYNIKPPYRYKYPHNLYGFFKTFLHNMSKKPKVGRYRYDIKKINTWIPVKGVRYIFETITGKKMPLIGYN